MPADAQVDVNDVTIKTPQEIVAHIRKIRTDGSDFFGFQASDLISFLPFEEAQPFLKPEATKDRWNPRSLDSQTVTMTIRDYMPFAWEKANGCRGLSASRSVEHMKAWLWLLGDDLCERLDDVYEYYGKTCLRAICEKYGWDWTQWDDGVWRNDEDEAGIEPPKSIAIPNAA